MEREVTHTATTMKDALRDPVGVLRHEVDAVGQRARDGLRSALASGSATLRDLDRRLAGVSGLDWTIGSMRRKASAFRKDGLVRLQALRTRAIERLDALPGEAITALATRSRTTVQDLSRGLDRAAERLVATVAPASASAPVAAPEPPPKAAKKPAKPERAA